MQHNLPQIDLAEIEAIFDEMVLISDPMLQQSMLEKRCEGNTPLLKRVQALLSAYSQGEFLESPAIPTAFGSKVAAMKGSFLGSYNLVELLAYGGMGEVYLARDVTSPHRLVAVKLLSEDLNTPHCQTRFDLEIQILRRVDHRGIVRMIDTGRTVDGRPYIVMELVRGLPIDQFCDRAALSIKDRLAIVIQVCNAIQHAHHLGIVHRDLKPANILVQRVGDEADVKIIDFGVAKCIGEHESIVVSLTRVEQILGTPSYMSPEQLDWSADVSPQSDVYSIGSIICKLLVGTTPFDSRLRTQANKDDGDNGGKHWPDVLDIQQLRQALLQDQPTKPSQILAEFPPDESEEIARVRSISLHQLRRELTNQLDWIVLKAISPQRVDRYSSAADLSADLQAVLDDRPTMAGPPSILNRAKKWSKRHSHLLKNIAISCLIAGSLFGFWWAKLYRDSLRSEADGLAKQRLLAERALKQKQYVADLRQAAIAIRTGGDISARSILEKYDQDGIDPQFDTFPLRYLKGLMLDPNRLSIGHDQGILDMDLSPDGTLMATCDRSGQILVHSTKMLGNTGCKPLAKLKAAEKEVTRVRFSPDGRLLASTGQEATVRLWSTKNWECADVLKCSGVTVNALVWSPNGRYLAAGDRGGRLFLWDAKTFEHLDGLPNLKGPLRTISWSPDEKMLAVAEDDQVSLWRLKHRQLVGRIQCASGVLVTEFSPNSQLLAIGGYFPELLLVDSETAEIEQGVPISHASAWSVHFLNSDALIIGLDFARIQYIHRQGEESKWCEIRSATISEDDSKARRIVRLPGTSDLFVAIEKSQLIARLDGNSFTGFDSLAANMPALGNRKSVQDFIGNESLDSETYCRPISNAVTGLTAVASKDDRGPYVGVYEKSTAKLIHRISSPARVRQLCFSPDGRQLAICSPDPLGEPLQAKKAAPILYHLDRKEVRSLAWPIDGSESRCIFTESGRSLIVGRFMYRELGCIESESGTLVRTQRLTSNFSSMVASNDGQHIFVGQVDSLSCFSADLCQHLWTLPSPVTITAIQECGDGRTISCLGYDGTLRLWDTKSREMLFELPLQQSGPPVYDFDHWLESPDPETLIFCGVHMPAFIRFRANR